MRFRPILFLVPLLTGAVSAFESEEIFPPEAFHNHSPSIVETPEGDLLACWFHGHGEKSDDTLFIEGARKEKTSEGWSERFVLADHQDYPDQNPVLFIDGAKRLWLFWISSLDNTRQTYMLKYRISNDFEGTGAPVWDWQDVLIPRPRNAEPIVLDTMSKVDATYGAAFDSEPKYRERSEWAMDLVKTKLGQRLGWMPRCAPIMVTPERMMLGLYSDELLTSMGAFTEDGGQTWEFGEPMPGYGGIQPSLVQKKDGTIAAYMRDKSPNKRIRYAESKDLGMSWSTVRDLDIPNPDSSVSVAVLKSGAWVMVCNDTTSGPRNGRTRLVALLSEDEGVSWPHKRGLEEHGESTAAAYPNVIQTQGGQVHCVYTYSPTPNETIKHVWFDEQWVKGKGD